MMNLIGIIEGIEVSFTFYPPNTFEATIPKSLSGIYVVQLIAVDDAGNQDSTTGLYVNIDTDKLSFKILPSTFESKKKVEFYSEELKSNFSHRELVLM